MSLAKQQPKIKDGSLVNTWKTATTIFAFENELTKELSVISSLPAEASNKYHH